MYSHAATNAQNVFHTKFGVLPRARLKKPETLDPNPPHFTSCPRIPTATPSPGLKPFFFSHKLPVKPTPASQKPRVNWGQGSTRVKPTTATPKPSPIHLGTGDSSRSPLAGLKSIPDQQPKHIPANLSLSKRRLPPTALTKQHYSSRVERSQNPPIARGRKKPRKPSKPRAPESAASCCFPNLAGHGGPAPQPLDGFEVEPVDVRHDRLVEAAGVEGHALGDAPLVVVVHVLAGASRNRRHPPLLNHLILPERLRGQAVGAQLVGQLQSVLPRHGTPLEG